MRVPVPAVILAAGLCLDAGLATAARAQAPNLVEGRALASGARAAIRWSRAA